MDARLQLRVQRYGWDSAAAYYHSAWEKQLGAVHDCLLEMAGIKPGQKIIETACGSGLVTSRLALHVGETGYVLATDLSQGMIDELRGRLEHQHGKTVEANRMPADKLDVPDQTFDAAICALGLMYMPDPAAALSEMARTVISRGRVAASVWGERRNCGWAEIFPIVDARVASEVCPMFFGTGAPNALKQIFEDAGLVELQEHRQSETLEFGSEQDLVDAVILGGPVALAVKRFDDTVWDEVCQEFLISVSDHKRPDGSYGIPGEFVTVSGVRPAA